MRSEAWRPAAAACNRSPREARDPARQALRPGCEELAARIRVMPETEARPRVKNRHGGAPRGERPASWDARRLASAWRAALCARPTGAAAPERLSALRHPSFGVGEARLQDPGAEVRRGNEKGCLYGKFCGTRCSSSSSGARVSKKFRKFERACARLE